MSGCVGMGTRALLCQGVYNVVKMSGCVGMGTRALLCQGVYNVVKTALLKIQCELALWWWMIFKINWLSLKEKNIQVVTRNYRR
jgi:hypothetical protein